MVNLITTVELSAEDAILLRGALTRNDEHKPETDCGRHIGSCQYPTKDCTC
jgi:hypothetical protein